MKKGADSTGEVMYI